MLVTCRRGTPGPTASGLSAKAVVWSSKGSSGVRKAGQSVCASVSPMTIRFHSRFRSAAGKRGRAGRWDADKVVLRWAAAFGEAGMRILAIVLLGILVVALAIA